MNATLDQLLEDFPFPASLADPTHRFVHVNPAFTDMYGWSREQIVGLPAAVLLPRNFSDAQLARILSRIADADEGWNGVVSHSRKDGRVIRMHCRTFPVKPSVDQGAVLNLGIYAPEAEMPRAETALVALLSGAVLNHGTGLLSARSLRVRRTRGEEICRLSALGYSRKEISSMMGISVSTVGVVLFRAKRRDGGR
jgi:PAS domain S-box-containing protein